MPRQNTATTYGSVTRAFHWLTALMILAAFPLGAVANRLPYDTAEALAFKAQLFSVHKTLGVAIFATACLRILWALRQTRPAPLHPDRRVETLAAETVHWALYLALVVVPLSGWIHHAAVDGFAPILWPLGQGLPFVPKSEAIAATAGSVHWLFTKIMLAAIALHVAGALKHAVIDRDGTLARMVNGSPAAGPKPPHSAAPALIALAIFAAGGAGAWALAKDSTAPTAITTSAPTVESGWQVTEGTLGFTVTQMGAKVSASLPAWTAAIAFDESTGTGEVVVRIDMGQLTVGSVTDQARTPEFLDTTSHPTASFTARITPQGDAYLASGTLNLKGAMVPVTLPFRLKLKEGTATMTGSLTLDRRDFGIGPSYRDEASVGFAVEVAIALTATRH